MKGEILEDIEIIDAGVKGKNIARSGNLVLLVEGVVPGDVADVYIYKKKKGYLEGRAVQIKKYSSERVQPVCSHFESCGGCSWQNMNYGKQLFFKEKMVHDAFERIGEVAPKNVLPIIGSANKFYYRNRLDFAFSDRKWFTQQEVMLHGLPTDAPGLGFHVSGKFDKVLDLKHCHLQSEPSNSIRNAFREWAINNGNSFFNPRTQQGFFRSLIIRTSTTGEVMVILIMTTKDEEKIESAMAFLHERFPSISSLYYVVNAKANDTVYDLPHILFSGVPYIQEKLNGVVYRVGPKSFFQTNPWQAETLFEKAFEYADLKADDVVLDLYCGVGTIALQVASKVKKVIGIETVEEAIEYAKENTTLNKISNATFFAGDVKNLLSEIVEQNGKPDVIIVDPPRSGMEPSVINKLLEIACEKVLYISCNPSTQARDIALMKENYEVISIQPMDLFPHTYHVENIAVLVRKSELN